MKRRKRSITPVNLTFLKEYAGKWVALSTSGKRVVASACTQVVAMKQARQRGEEHPLLIKSPSRTTGHYIFLAHGRF